MLIAAVTVAGMVAAAGVLRLLRREPRVTLADFDLEVSDTTTSLAVVTRADLDTLKQTGRPESTLWASHVIRRIADPADRGLPYAWWVGVSRLSDTDDMGLLRVRSEDGVSESAVEAAAEATVALRTLSGEVEA